MRHRQAEVPPGRLRGAPVRGCWGGGAAGVTHGRLKQAPAAVYSLLGVEGVAGAGPGVRMDGSGDRRAGSSAPFLQPLTWRAARALFFLQDLR